MFYMGTGTRALFVSQASRDMSVFFVLKIYSVYKHKLNVK